jgi:hypothetical protein
MPHSSPWPILLAASLSVMFTLLIVQKFVYASIFAVLIGLTLLGWHGKEPQQA